MYTAGLTVEGIVGGAAAKFAELDNSILQIRTAMDEMSNRLNGSIAQVGANAQQEQVRRQELANQINANYNATQAAFMEFKSAQAQGQPVEAMKLDHKSAASVTPETWDGKSYFENGRTKLRTGSQLSTRMAKSYSANGTRGTLMIQSPQWETTKSCTS